MRTTHIQFFLSKMVMRLIFVFFITMGLSAQLFCDVPHTMGSINVDSATTEKQSKDPLNNVKAADDAECDEEDENEDAGTKTDEENEDEKNETEARKDKVSSDDKSNDVEPFPFAWVKPAANTLGSGASDTTLVSDKALFSITGYFSPTCGHCGQFFKNELPEIRLKYINPGKIKLGIRPYCHHPIDFIVTQIACCRGPDRFVELFSLFMENQEAWFGLLLVPLEEKEKRKEVIAKMLEQLPNTIDRTKALVQFNINEENSSASVIIFALTHGFSVDEIDAAINSPKAEEVSTQLIVGTLAAKDDKGEGVAAIPTFYVDEVYQKDPLSVADFDSLVKTGQIVARPKEATQTAVPTTSPVNAATQAFASIAPPQ
ncbi:MAG: thioredoxin domain-containing protein [Pseudomonadota bacterium]